MEFATGTLRVTIHCGTVIDACGYRLPPRQRVPVAVPAPAQIDLSREKLFSDRASATAATVVMGVGAFAVADVRFGRSRIPDR